MYWLGYVSLVVSVTVLCYGEFVISFYLFLIAVIAMVMETLKGESHDKHGAS